MTLGELPPVPGRNPRPTRAHVRRQLLDAARAVFAAKGYDGASVEEVAAHAGLTKGAVYSNFAGKDDLFLALAGEEVRARIALVEELTDLPESTTDWAKAVGAALTSATMHDPAWQVLLTEFWLRAMRDDTAREQFAEYRRQLRRLTTVAIERLALRRGMKLPLPAEQLATVLFSLSNGLALEGLLDPPSVPAQLFGDTLTALLD